MLFLNILSVVYFTKIWKFIGLDPEKHATWLG